MVRHLGKYCLSLPVGFCLTIFVKHMVFTNAIRCGGPQRMVRHVILSKFVECWRNLSNTGLSNVECRFVECCLVECRIFTCRIFGLSNVEFLVCRKSAMSKKRRVSPPYNISNIPISPSMHKCFFVLLYPSIV